MPPQNNFTRFAAICCFLTVITTLGIHLCFPDPPADFEERVKLYRNNQYLFNRWWVIVHCLLVIISMWGFALLQFKKSPGAAGLGFLFITVFALAEITRQLMVFFYINELREQYAASNDPFFKESVKVSLTNAGLFTASLFGLFILSFGLGNLFNGVSLLRGDKFDRLMALLLIAWGCATLIGFGNIFWEITAISDIIEVYNYSFQPLVRALLAAWLWKRAVG